MKRLSCILFIAITLSAQSIQAANVIKCKNSEGEISYADTTCPAGQTELRQIQYKEYKASKNSSLRSLEKGTKFPEQKSSLSAKSIALFQSRITQVLQSILPVKQKIQEYYLSRQKWPLALNHIGYKSREMTSDLITKTEITLKGQLSVKLSRSFGSKKEIRFYPKLEMGGTQIRWVCYTNFPAAQLSNKVDGRPICLSRYF